jgi:isoquinoline 1-oxidoreductase
MLYGKVLRPPSFGATLTSYDAKTAQEMDGVVIVHDGDFIGAAAGNERDALKALEVIHAEWKELPQSSSKELFSYLKQNAVANSDNRSRRTKGSVEDGLSAAKHRLDATYTVAFIAHAPLEPRAALAEWSKPPGSRALPDAPCKWFGPGKKSSPGRIFVQLA